MYKLNPLCPMHCWWTANLILSFSYCKLLCDSLWHACIPVTGWLSGWMGNIWGWCQCTLDIVFCFLRNLYTDFHSGSTTLERQSMIVFLHPCQHLYVFFQKYLSNRVGWNIKVVFTSGSQMDSDAEHICSLPAFLTSDSESVFFSYCLVSLSFSQLPASPEWLPCCFSFRLP